MKPLPEAPAEVPIPAMLATFDAEDWRISGPDLPKPFHGTWPDGPACERWSEARKRWQETHPRAWDGSTLERLKDQREQRLAAVRAFYPDE
jgi:hypothetical protein